MSLTGRLDEVSVPEILHLLSWGEKTGKLTISRGAAEGVVVFCRGRIVNAASNSPRETLGSILVCRKLVSEDALMNALEERDRGEAVRSLGATLVAMGAITPEELESAVRQQIEHVMTEFVLWETGLFRFEPMELPHPAAGATDPECRSGRSFNTEQVLLEAIKRVDDVRRRREEYAADSGGPVPAALMGDDLRPSPFVLPRSRSATLNAIVADLQAPVMRGEASLTILRHAKGLVRRAVLFLPSHRGFVGSGQFGIEVAGDSADEHIRRVLMPLDQASVLADVAAKRGTYRGLLPLCFWNEFLIKQLGGVFPREVVVVPAILDGTVVALLYGDNVPSNAPIGPTTSLEAAMLEACARYVRPLPAENHRGQGSTARAAAHATPVRANS